MTRIDDEIQKQYESLTKQSKGASYYKVDLHIHTPGSKRDYEVVNGLDKIKYYEKWTVKEIINLGYERGMINDELYQRLLKMDPQPDRDAIMAELIVFEAAEKKGLDLIVITDHNTMAWYYKIDEAAKRRISKPFTVLPGAEITCYGGTHIIAIFNPQHSIEQWKNLSIKLDFDDEVETIDGPITIRSEIEVVKAINEVGALSYIPHLDNNKHRYTIKHVIEDLSGKSKIQLLTDPCLNALGFSQYDHHRFIKAELCDSSSKYKRDAPLAYLQDSDAHTLDDIGNKPMFFKMSEPCFESLRFCFDDPDLRIYPPDYPIGNGSPYIIGVAINGGIFLDDDKKDWLFVRFNESLNCIIGAKGTGKSTLLNCVVATLKRKVVSENQLEFLCSFGRLLVYFILDGKVYCAVLNPTETPENVRQASHNLSMSTTKWSSLYLFNKNTGHFYRTNLKGFKEKANRLMADSIDQAQIIEASMSVQNFSLFFHRLIESSSFNNKLNEIQDRKKELDKKLKKLKYESDRKKYIDSFTLVSIDVEKYYYDLEYFYRNLLEEINKELDGRIRMSLIDSSEKRTFVYQSILVEEIETVIHNKKMNNAMISIAHNLVQTYEPSELLSKLFLQEYETIILEAKIQDEPTSQRDIEEGYYKAKEVLAKYRELFVEKYPYNLAEIRRDHYFKLEFNTRYNKFSHDQVPSNYVDLFKLSYGQKSVALLSLIMDNKIFSGNNAVLIIDQPEDQLDNSYIYDNLIEDLRTMKNIRQIILVTHSPTIPVAGDAEQVIVMASNGSSCSVENTGSIDSQKIQKDIVAKMEGGEKSLKIRLRKYSLIGRSFNLV